ncbi:hypothetical protein [Ensifer sp.]|jgi:hypothetical protein|uniref:hypothetical protein n=1 Tax=Ensifer sp. TaxID=1872086 RepID=UPI002E0DC414|nr:hypothetical protein [Ensifer sp.]
MQFKTIEKLVLVVAPLALSLMITGFLIRQTVQSNNLKSELAAARQKIEQQKSVERLMARLTYATHGLTSSVSLVAASDNRLLLSVPLDAVAQLSRLPPLPETANELSLAYLQMKTLGAIIQTLPDGRVTLNAPKRMTLGEMREVSALVGVGVPREKLEAVFREGDQHFAGAAKISHKMRARLTGVNFKVEGVTTEEQVVALGVPSLWKWKVNASTEGTQTLTAIIYAVVQSADEEVEIMIDSYEQDIVVETKPMTARDVWEGIKTAVSEATTMWVAVGGFLVAAFAYTRKRYGKFLRWARSKSSVGDSENLH